MCAQLRTPGVFVGHASDLEGGTGCTVILAPEGATASLDVRGMAPGTRETDLLSPWSSVDRIQAVIFCGGSAPGLGAADGVVRFLEDRGYGYQTPYARIPLVAGAVVYDLGVGRADARPGPGEGYAAAESAGTEFAEGTVGVGTGATVGKVLAEAGWMKGGVGFAGLRLPGEIVVEALTVVNAFGDVLAEDGRVLAGARTDGGFLDTRAFLLEQRDYPLFAARGGNTTLSTVITNASLDKTQCAMVARMSHDGLARAISPVHTPVDGDTVFTLATGEREGGVFQVGTAAVEVVAQSVRRAVRLATGLGGVPSLRDIESVDEAPDR